MTIEDKPADIMASNQTTGISVNLSTGEVNAGTVQFRNRIINGDMRIAQRGTSVAYQNADNGLYKFMDRYLLAVGGGSTSVTASQDVDVPTETPFMYSLKLVNNNATSDSTNDLLEIQQRIEGYNVQDLVFGTSKASSISVSFWAKTSLSNAIYAMAIRNVFQRSYTIVFSPTSTWRYFQFVIPGDTTGTWNKTTSTGLVFSIALTSRTNLRSTTLDQWVTGNLPSHTSATNIGSVAGATFHVTGIQLEKGPKATPFEFRPYPVELQMCQRYCELIIRGVWGWGGASGLQYATYPFKVTKRAIPTTEGGAIFSTIYAIYEDGISISRNNSTPDIQNVFVVAEL